MSGLRKACLRSAVYGAVLAATYVSAQDTHDHSEQLQPEQNDAHDHAAHAEHTHATQSERAHVPPDPPATPMPDMSEERMIELMQMEDNAAFSMVLLDQFEWRAVEEDPQVWELQAYYGTDYNKLWFETEGEHVESEEEGRAELLWDHIVSPWWSMQSGVRHDFSDGPSRTWGAIGVQGLAPLFFRG